LHVKFARFVPVVSRRWCKCKRSAWFAFCFCDIYFSVTEIGARRRWNGYVEAVFKIATIFCGRILRVLFDVEFDIFFFALADKIYISATFS
jgi:hypothetical protein